ncbi:conserved hypothetical protein [Histoplasma capsulatum G186AR]|uniref:Telomere-associated protein Rif1 N-terminal domain-containing protein n=2 Tax=Ajellomyces capsulatus TaxID=5037 RepID=C0NNA2_AJECG|nr:uncharacterized protein HCBG_04229 [Histoplasma capsulatum G186AR]EEH07350.1 conserved hypothetical protein [Histoplasma capsulatum G186AR]KAG5304523.1 telomere length regulator protein [Histoplasma capsulatum]QSS70121.1 telomere length regulator protein [Histoplasma capsulatum G186AR]
MVEVLSFSALPARPPTPPRSSSLKSAVLKSDIQQLPSHQAPLSTPSDGFSSPPNLSPFPQSSGLSKRVNFSPLTSYIKPPSFPTSNAHKSRTPLRALPPSNQCKPSKSILKSSCSSPASTPPAEQSFNSSDHLPAMLESICKQLAGGSRTSRADAYQHLLGTLAAYSNIPDEGALADQVETFSQYIRRDICEVSGIYQPLDIKLVRQALKLLAMFIYEPKFSSRLPDDLEVFVIDHAIASLQNPNVPKTVAIEYMRVLSMQKCSPKVMTSNRVTLLLSVLKDITNRVEGKAVLAHRLAIYRELLLLPQSTMASHADLWMDHLITALLHNLKDIRTRAIKVGKLAAMAMGPNTTVSVALREVLDVTLENGSPFVAELCDRLSAMISSPDSGSQVPQIWSVIILLLRTKRWSIDNWPHLKDWLLVIQRCFNCSDIMTKSQALMAWDLFVYALSPNESTSTDITKILFRPILSQLERKKSDKQGILVNQAFTSYHRLLYYAFRPSASHSRLAFFWTIYIGNPFSGNLNSDPTNNERLCRILSYLLWNQQPKIWEEDKIGIIKGTTLEPEDLPRLDCRWIRSRLPIILPVFKSLFKSSAWNDDDIAKSGIGLSWTNLSKALSDAGSNEITPSSESMQAIASILGTLQRVWRTAPLSLNANGDTRNDTFYKRFQFLLTTVVSSTGPAIFTDKLFAQISQDRFQTATTPAHNRQSVDNNVKSPLLHLLHLITFSPLPSSTISSAYFQLLHVIIEMGVQGKTSRYAKLEVLRQFADLLLEQSGNVSDVNLECLSNCHHVWQSIAKLAKGYLLAFPMRTEIMKRDGSAPNDYENVITILVAGSRFESSFSEWSLLLDSFSSVVRAEKGEAALTGILETLSETISSQPLAAVAGNCAALLDLLKFTSVQEQPPSPTHPSINKSPFAYRQIQHHSGNKLIELTSKVLKEIYVELAGTDHSRIVRFLASTTKLIDRCPSSFGPILLSELQDSLGLWITDRDGVLTSRPDVGNNISASARELILSTTKLLQKSAELKDTLLQKLSTLVTSGLESRHKFTANQFIKLWNNSFGSRTTLEYPENVEKALRRLKPFVHLSLPNFPQEENSTIDLSSPDFLSSQEDMVESETPIKLLDSTSKIYKAFSPSPAQSTTPSSTNKACRRKRSTPSTSKLSTPKPRLRHDDSQIRFVPVDSSPAPNAVGDAQVLTDHQREVRDRQRGETARQYPGLRSSDSQLDRDTSYPPLPAKLGGFKNEENALPSPVLHLPIEGNEENFPDRSPTSTPETSVVQLDQMVKSHLISVLDIAGRQSEDPPSSPPQISHHENRSIEASETKRICDVKNQEIVMSDDLSSPPRSSPTPISGDPSHRRSMFSSRKTAEWKATRTNKVINPEPKDITSQGDYPSIFPTQDADLVPSEESENKGHSNSSNPNCPVSNIEVDRIDIIPDSFSNDLERQIASQLEQDLELSMDMEVSSKGTPEPNASIVTRSMKRKRDDKSSQERDRIKRVSPNRRSKVVVDESVASEKIPSHQENITCGNEVVPSKRPSRSSRKKTNSILDSAKIINPSQEIGKPAHCPNHRKSKKRRSLRLSGQPALPAPSVEQRDEQMAHQMSPDSEMAKNTAADVEMSNQTDHPYSKEGDLAGSTEQETRSGKPETSGAGILASLRSVLGSIRTVTFGRRVLREIEDVMFDIKVEAHDAERRHNGNA